MTSTAVSRLTFFATGTGRYDAYCRLSMSRSIAAGSFPRSLPRLTSSVARSAVVSCWRSTVSVVTGTVWASGVPLRS